MNSLVPYSPQYLTLDPSDKNTGQVFDGWSKPAIGGQGTTASAFAIWQWPTESGEQPLVRSANCATNSVDQTPDALVSSSNWFANDAVANAIPNFVLRGAAPPLGKSKGNTNAVLAEWEGYVTEVHDETIEARLTGLMGAGVEGEVEEAAIPKSEIADADKSLVAVGALFRLCISYEKTEAGERRRYSTLVFRRLPAYRQQDLDRAHERTRARLNGLRLD